MFDGISQTCFFVPGISRVECASWVQSLGSILAIIAAFFVASHQARLARRHDRDREASVIEAFATLIGHLRIFLLISAEAHGTTPSEECADERTRTSQRAKDVIEAINRIPIENMKTAISMGALLNIKRMIRLVLYCSETPLPPVYLMSIFTDVRSQSWSNTWMS